MLLLLRELKIKDFEWCKGKHICQVSYDNRFIYRPDYLQFILGKWHDIDNKASFVWNGCEQVFYKKLALALSDDLGVESDTAGLTIECFLLLN